MFNAQDFVGCITDNLKGRGFGHVRIKEIVDEYKATAKAFEQAGNDGQTAAQLAMKDVFDNMSRETLERAKHTAKMISVQADNIARIEQGENAPVSLFLMDGKPGSKGVAFARAAYSLIESDPRFAGGSYSSALKTIRGQLYALFGDALESSGKGAFGRQKGKAHLPNIIREIKGEATGDKVAKSFADAYAKMTDLTVDMFNAAGGSMNKLARYVPQSMNAVRMVKAGKPSWVKFHMSRVDWEATRWPDGTQIPADKRQSILEKVFDTLTLDGNNKIDISEFRGKGKALGNKLDTHRFMHYKDADGWLEAHKAYGDGNVFDALMRHVESMSHDIAMVQTFGANPEMTALNVKAIVRSKAAAVGAKELADAEAVLKNKFDPAFETINRENPMDPHSTFGALVTGASNIVTSAVLGSASLLAIPGDFMQTAAIRALNGMDIFGGVDFYMKSLVTDAKFMREISTQSGFVMDEVVMSTYSTARYTGIASTGPALTRHISEATMRLSLLSGHTRAARWAVQSEFMGLMNRSKNMAFEELPFAKVMERYDINADDWDAFRKNVQTWEPRKDVAFMRPIDINKTNLPNKDELFGKFQGMIYDEAQHMVPESTLEGGVALKGTTRPDTLVGALMYSFAMYKNFPISFAMIYGRMAMTSPSVKGRLGFIAAFGAGMTLVGALGTQLREVSKGREPLPMDNAAFWGKAFLSGGALSIWGDFLFSGVNEYNRGPEQVAAGPLVALLGDTTDLLLGDVFQFAGAMGSLSDKEFKSTTAAKAVEYAKRYTPGTSIWWARAALEHQVFDRLQELADPKVYEKRRRRVAKQKAAYGNGYWWAPGQRTP